MKRSTKRILTTHVGSLPRPQSLMPLLAAKEAGESVDATSFDSKVHEATAEIVRKQIQCGLDVINDGEVAKIGYVNYVKSRLAGFGGQGGFPGVADLDDYPEYTQRFLKQEGEGLATLHIPACNGPIEWTNFAEVEKEIGDFKAALKGANPEESFLTAASPGIIALYLKNDYYRTYEEYVFRIAEVMRREYNAIHRAGFVLQLDCPDLGYGRHSAKFAGKGVDEFVKYASVNVEAINQALVDIPPEGVRMHICWGNYEGPHHLDVDLRDIVKTVFKAKAGGFLLEAANPRHEHEWRVFEEFKPPEGTLVIPGVIDTCTNYVEHPDLVADRICRYAELVGRENVIASTDCGFATFSGFLTVDPKITWAKLQALTEGARRASKRLWKSK